MRIMSDYGFEWDAEKARQNLKKHGVSFIEAASIFDDANLIELFDEMHSETEKRHLAIGMSKNGRLLVVSYTPRGENLSIINARTAGKRLEQSYEQEKD
jgi:uncharacterized DUF497 family protein